jgi:hypothetical protein
MFYTGTYLADSGLVKSLSLDFFGNRSVGLGGLELNATYLHSRLISYLCGHPKVKVSLSPV